MKRQCSITHFSTPQYSPTKMAAAAASSLTLPFFTNQTHLLRRPPPSYSPLPTLLSQPLLPSLWFKSSTTNQPLHLGSAKERSWSALKSSQADSPPPATSEKWLLEPVGDGDYRHIGFKVALPSAFEIVSSAVTVGRVPEKADVVIPVATVSGMHARLEKKEGLLLVTDLNSTNGTFIGDKKLKPGAVTILSPGNYITFGDTNLAMFRVSKIEESEPTSKEDESAAKVEAEVGEVNGSGTVEEE